MLNDGTPTRGDSVLDLTLADVETVGCISNGKVIASPGLSDHNTIIFQFCFHGETEQLKNKTLEAPGRPKNWEQYRKIATDWVKYCPSKSADFNATKITVAVREAAEITIGRVEDVTRPHPWWNDRLQLLKKEKRKLQRKLTTSLKANWPERHAELRRQFNNAKRRLQRGLQRRKRIWREMINRSLINSDLSSRQMWRNIRSPLQRRTNKIPKMIDEDGNCCNLIGQKIDVLLRQFMNPPQPRDLTENDRRHYQKVESFFKKTSEADRVEHPLDRPLVLQEVLRVISELKTNKASGPDEIHNVLLKKLPIKAWREITKVFNACLREGTHPKVWNRANVVPVPKPGKKLDRAEHYRPIAVSSCLGRVLEKCLSDRLQTYCVVRKVFNNNQCGFQPNRRTTDVISLLLNDAHSCWTAENRVC